MIIFLYLIRELLKSSLAILAVLMLVFLSNQFVRLLAGAASGKYPSELVWPLLCLNVPYLAGMLLPLSFFLAVLLSYGRLHAEHELTVMTACGLSLRKLLRLTFYPAIVFTLLCAAIFLWLSPWGLEQTYVLQQNATEKMVQQPFEPGKFHQLSGGGRIIFIDDSEIDSSIGRVFLAQQGELGAPLELLVAQSGRFVNDAQSGSDYLLLDQGFRYVASPGQSAAQLIEFAQYGMKVQNKPATPKKRKIKALPTLSLLAHDGILQQAELQWRISMPLSLLILAWIAVPLSRVQPRQGKFAKFLPGISIYFSYFILLSVARNLVESEKLPIQIGMWWVHGLFVILALWLVYLQSAGFKRAVRQQAVTA